jgi:outer membrane receptor protein involved in Fe transport
MFRLGLIQILKVFQHGSLPRRRCSCRPAYWPPGPNSWGGVQLPLALSTSGWKYAGFIQNNWRASDNLTLNIGLRYDIEMPRTERYNRMSYIDINAPSPITASGLDLRGAPSFTNDDTRTPYDPDTNNFAPRVGFAYAFNVRLRQSGQDVHASRSRLGVRTCGLPAHPISCPRI